jgi:hypothetical protein
VEKIEIIGICELDISNTVIINSYIYLSKTTDNRRGGFIKRDVAIISELTFEVIICRSRRPLTTYLHEIN